VEHHERGVERLRLRGIEPLGGQRDMEPPPHLSLGGEGGAGEECDHRKKKGEGEATRSVWSHGGHRRPVGWKRQAWRDDPIDERLSLAAESNTIRALPRRPRG